MDLIKFGWNNKYAVDGCFDLNQLREFKKVKELGKKCVPADESDDKIAVEIGINFTEGAEEVEKLDIDALTAERDNYKRWWSEGSAEFNKLKKDFECLKASIEIMKKEEKDETNL